MSELEVEWLTGCEAYFSQVLEPNCRAFFDAPSNFATALNLATSLYHFHEWLFLEYESHLESFFSQAFANKGQFWERVERDNNKFGYIRDVTNASKHVIIGEHHRTSTGMTHIANTRIVRVAYGMGGYGEGKFGGGPNIVFAGEEGDVSFDDCARDLFEYWKALLLRLIEKELMSPE